MFKMILLNKYIIGNIIIKEKKTKEVKIEKHN